MVECYPHADFVLDCSSLQALNASAERLIEIYFGHPFVSPTKDEYASYVANAASYRSLDLSRQVGAAIFSNQCEIIALGCNEVPKAGGGTYWTGENDHRDYAIGYDSNQKVRDDMTRDTLERLQKKKWLSERQAEFTPDELVAKAFGNGNTPNAPLNDAMIRDVIEYGRMVHAEMNALSDAARFGRPTKNAILYCTTMPCHMCAKLIVASGIRRVVYVQPYTKSLVEELYSDSIIVDGPANPKKVKFDSLKGVTPNGFRIAFRKAKRRKDEAGKALDWNRSKAVPTFLSYFPYYQHLEGRAVADFQSAMEALKRRYPQQVQMPLKVATRKRKAKK